MTQSAKKEQVTVPRYTKGGVWGHVFRRSIHICILFIPLLYFHYAAIVAGSLQLTPRQLLIVLLILIILFEIVRLKMRWLIWGQRQHEARQISSFAWGVVAVCLVLLFVTKPYAIPIIWCSALVDPLLGELKSRALPMPWLVIIGLIAVAVIWGIASLWLGTPAWMIIIMAPLTIAAEWPNFKWIDDNALMMILPLLVVFLLV